MIRRCVILIYSLLLLSNSCVQSQNTEKDIYYDLDSIPIFVVSHHANTIGDSVIYYRQDKYDRSLLEGKKKKLVMFTPSDSIYYFKQNGINRNLVRIKCDVGFWKGEEALRNFCDNLYYNRSDYIEWDVAEVVNFCIVFDEYLHIQDIRFFRRFHPFYDKIRNYIMLYNILAKTQGHWMLMSGNKNLNVKTKNWHLYIGSYTFY